MSKALAKYDANSPAREAGERYLDTARWMTPPEGPVQHFKPGLQWLMHTTDGAKLGVTKEGHTMLYGATRGGKGVSYIVPAILMHARQSLVVIDPIGENAMVTARARAGGSAYCHGMGQTTYVLDPYGAAAKPGDNLADLQACFNPLDMIRFEDDDAVGLAALMAEALIPTTPKNESYWDDSARELLAAGILYVASSPDLAPDERTLMTVHTLLFKGDEEAHAYQQMNCKPDETCPSAMELLLMGMEQSQAFDGAISATGARFLEEYRKAPKTLTGTLGVVRTNINFINDPGMKRVLSKSSFSLSELKTDPNGVSLYICIPEWRQHNLFRWLRLMLTLTITEMQRIRHLPASGGKVSFVIDEFALLQRMNVVERAIAHIASRGVSFLLVVQDYGQLRTAYKDGWETLSANCRVKVYLNIDSGTDREYISKLMGEHEMVRRTRNGSQSESDSSGWSSSKGASFSSGQGGNAGTSYGPQGGSGSSGSNWSSGFSESYNQTRSGNTTRSQSSGYTETLHKRPLLTPSEIGVMFGNEQDTRALALISGCHPLVLQRVPYYADPTFAGWFDRHRDHTPPPTIALRLQWQRQALADEKARAERERLARIAAHEQYLRDNKWKLRIERWKGRIQSFLEPVFEFVDDAAKAIPILMAWSLNLAMLVFLVWLFGGAIARML